MGAACSGRLAGGALGWMLPVFNRADHPQCRTSLGIGVARPCHVGHAGRLANPSTVANQQGWADRITLSLHGQAVTLPRGNDAMAAAFAFPARLRARCWLRVVYFSVGKQNLLLPENNGGKLAGVDGTSSALERVSAGAGVA
jgi:hypothetical protein